MRKIFLFAILLLLAACGRGAVETAKDLSYYALYEQLNESYETETAFIEWRHGISLKYPPGWEYISARNLYVFPQGRPYLGDYATVFTINSRPLYARHAFEGIIDVQEWRMFGFNDGSSRPLYIDGVQAFRFHSDFNSRYEFVHNNLFFTIEMRSGAECADEWAELQALRRSVRIQQGIFDEEEPVDFSFLMNYFVFENYFAVGIDADERLEMFEYVNTMWFPRGGEAGAGFAIWAVNEPLAGFEILEVNHGVCSCCLDFYFVPGNTFFALDGGFSSYKISDYEPLRPGHTVVRRDYVGRSHSPTFGVAFTDGSGVRRYVGILRCLAPEISGTPFLLKEFALPLNLDDETLPRATLPWAFPQGHDLPRYLLFHRWEVRSTIAAFDLWGMGLGDEGIVPLRYMRYLESVALMEDGIRDLTPLAGLTNLRSLALRDNYITDISPLAGLTNLRWLGLESNQISDISPLAELKNLENLHLTNNPIEDWSPVEHIQQVRGRNIENYPDTPPIVEFATALTAFFADAIPSPHPDGRHGWMPYSTHAIFVDLDGRGTQGILASRWAVRENHRGALHPWFQQNLFWFCGGELRKEPSNGLEEFGVTPAGRLVIMAIIGACNITQYSHTLLDFAAGELSFAKSVVRVENWSLGWMLGDYDDPDYLHIHGNEYAVRTYTNGNPWQLQGRDWESTPITHEEFCDIMTRYGIHGATTRVWEFSDETHAILAIGGFVPILNAYAEFSHPDFSVRDVFLEHRYYIERDYRFRRENHALAPAIKYALHDINGDGSPELFVGIGTACEDPLSIHVIYAKQNGISIPVIFRDVHNGIHLSSDIYGGYVIHRSWARMGGAGNAAYIIGENGILIRMDYVMATMVFDEHSVDEHGSWAFMYDRHSRYVDGELIPITEEEYEAFFIRYGVCRYATGEIELEWRHILQ